jgi:hypothetical protein
MWCPVMEEKNGKPKKQILLYKMFLKKIITGAVLFISTAPFCLAQLNWVNADSLYAPLPPSVHVFKTTDSIGGKPNIAFYIIADLKDQQLEFTVDTVKGRRITPFSFYEKLNKPLLVVNCSFFSYETNNSVNVIVKDGKMLNYNIHTIALRGKDTFTYAHPFRSALGITKKRKADIGWVMADSTMKLPYISQKPYTFRDSFNRLSSFITKRSRSSRTSFQQNSKQSTEKEYLFTKWIIKTVVGGGPVLLQNQNIFISNNEEMMFSGKAKENHEPRTAMGYTADGKLILLVVEGRNKGIAEGMSLTQLAQIFKELGCVEALNLDGGGSSCLLINGKETIKPSSAGVQRPVPAVFLIQQKKK